MIATALLGSEYHCKKRVVAGLFMFSRILESGLKGKMSSFLCQSFMKALLLATRATSGRYRAGIVPNFRVG